MTIKKDADHVSDLSVVKPFMCKHWLQFAGSRILVNDVIEVVAICAIMILPTGEQPVAYFLDGVLNICSVVVVKCMLRKALFVSSRASTAFQKSR